jgi:hypothetical protein
MTKFIARSFGSRQDAATLCRSDGVRRRDRESARADLLRRRHRVRADAAGDETAAARLWGIAEDQERQLGFRMLLNERRRYERVMSRARERLGAAGEAGQRAGAGLTFEQAVAEAPLHVAV